MPPTLNSWNLSNIPKPTLPNHTLYIPYNQGWGVFPNPTYQQFPAPWLSVVPLVLVDVLLLEEFKNLIGSSKEGALRESSENESFSEVQVEGSPLQQVSLQQAHPCPFFTTMEWLITLVIFEEFERVLFYKRSSFSRKIHENPKYPPSKSLPLHIQQG